MKYKTSEINHLIEFHKEIKISILLSHKKNRLNKCRTVKARIWIIWRDSL